MTDDGRKLGLSSEAVGLLIPLVFALGPVVALLVATRITAVPPAASIARMCGVAIVVVAVAYRVLRRRGFGQLSASNILGLPLFFVAIFPSAVQLVKGLAPLTESQIAWVYLLLLPLLGWLAGRLAPARAAALRQTLAIVAGVFLAFSISVVVGLCVRRLPPESAAVVNKLSGQLPIPRQVPTRPDVFHLVLDGLGRPDVLEARYAVDVAPTMAALRALGFDISEDGFANYVQTHLSLASMLNVTYLDELCRLQPDSNDRRPLRALMDRPNVTAAFKQLGYHVTQIGTGSHSEGVWEQADECDCPQLWLSEPELGVLSLTPLTVLRDMPIGHGHFLRRALRTFEGFEAPRGGSAPQYVFAHVMLPHPPFLVDADGHYLPRSRPSTFADASFYGGAPEEYIEGYRAQTTFVLRRMLDAVGRVLRTASEKGRQAIVIVHGDHGPRLGMDAVSPAAESGKFVLPVLLAIRWPPGFEPEAEPRSLVNLYRSLFRTVFHIDVESLPDRAYLSGFDTPCRLVPVTTAELMSSTSVDNPW